MKANASRRAAEKKPLRSLSVVAIADGGPFRLAAYYARLQGPPPAIATTERTCIATLFFECEFVRTFVPADVDGVAIGDVAREDFAS